MTMTICSIIIGAIYMIIMTKLTFRLDTKERDRRRAELDADIKLNREMREKESLARLEIAKAEFPWIGAAKTWEEVKEIALARIKSNG